MGIQEIDAGGERMVRPPLIQLHQERMVVILLQLVGGFRLQVELGPDGVEGCEVVDHHL